METLTDNQCDDFRRLPGSFNDMVRKIFEAGRMTGAQEACDVIWPERGTVSQFAKAENCEAFNLGLSTAIRAIENHFDFKSDPEAE